MKKFLSAAMSAIIACASIFSCTLTAFAEDAETEDVTIDCSSAEAASNWTQSLTIEQGDFNATRLTKDSKIVVTFNSEATNTVQSLFFRAGRIQLHQWHRTVQFGQR